MTRRGLILFGVMSLIWGIPYLFIRIAVDEITIIGSRCGPFGPALDLLARKRVDVKSLIQARYPLREGVRALEQAQQPGMLKVIIDVA